MAKLKTYKLIKSNSQIQDLHVDVPIPGLREVSANGIINLMFGKSYYRKTFRIQSHEYTIGSSLGLIKKILVYLLHGLHIFTMYINIKTDNQYTSTFPDCIAKEIQTTNLEILKQGLLGKNKQSVCLKFDESLLNKSIPWFLDHIDIQLFQDYIHLTQVVLPSERGSVLSSVSRKLSITVKDKQSYEFRATDYEIDDLLSAKRKRGDEGLKHCFKAVRKGVFKIFKNSEREITSVSTLKKKFFREYFKNDKELIKYFKENNITKETISNLKKSKKFNEQAEMYKKSDLLKDQVDRNIFDKREEILKENLSFQDFAKVLLDKQKKHGWILQNIMNSIEMYDNCSVDLKPRKRKKKEKEVL